MSEYMKKVGTSSIKSDKILNTDDCKWELLPAYLAKQPNYLNDPEMIPKITEMLDQWYWALASGFNIVVKGPLSKFRLLETFRARHLNKIKPDSTKWPLENITIVRLHGFEPISMQTFTCGLFHIHDNRRYKKEFVDDFLKTVVKNKRHVVFLIHSFEELHKGCTKVCDLIFQMVKQEPMNVHMVMSSDFVDSALILDKYRASLRLMYYFVPCGESFFYEKTQVLPVLNTIESSSKDKESAALSLFRGQTDLQSLKDIYTAVQPTCRKILVFIIKTYVERAARLETVQDESKKSDEQEGNGKSKKKDPNPRRSVRLKVETAEMNFEEVMRHCETEFIVRRPVELRAHLDELADHRIIELDARSKMKCLIEVEICKKFLAYAGSS